MDIERNCLLFNTDVPCRSCHTCMAWTWYASTTVYRGAACHITVSCADVVQPAGRTMGRTVCYRTTVQNVHVFQIRLAAIGTSLYHVSKDPPHHR